MRSGAASRALASIGFLLAEARAQQGYPADIQLGRLGTEDGLTHAAVRALAQDRTGYLWLGSPAGLDRWDGYDVVHYDLRGDGPLTSSVTALLADAGDTLWVGTTSGLLTLDRASGRATPRPLPGGAAPVHGLLEDRHRRVWVGAGARLHVGGADGFTEVVFPRAADEDRRAAITAIADRPAGPLALLRELEPRRASLIWPAPDGTSARLELLPPAWSDAYGLHVDGEGRAWIDPWHVGEPTAGGAFAWRRLEGGPDEAISARICQSPDGSLWFAADDGVYVRRAGASQPIKVLPDPGGASWQRNSLLSCLVDRGGNVWLGSLAGVYRWYRWRKPFRLLHHDPVDATSLGGDPVSSLALDGGRLWVGVYGGGLDEVDVATGRTVRHHRQADGPGALCDDRVWSLALGEETGTLWVGTEIGLCRLSPDGTFTQVAVPGLPAGTPGARVKAIAPQGDGALWLGTNFGLLRYDPERGVARSYVQGPEPGGLASRQVGDLLLEEPAALWIGSTDGELQRLDLARGTFRHFRLLGPDGAPVRHAVYDVERAPDGNLWVATHVGLARFDEAAGRLTLAIPGESLPGPIVYSVRAGDAGSLWLGTSRGLARVDPRTGAVRAFGLDDGVGNLEFNRHAALDLGDGRLAFGGMAGLTVFRPADVRDDPTPPPVALTSVQVIGARGERSIPTHGLAALELGPRDYAVTFELAALAFAPPSALRYAYRLEGFDGDFTEAGDRRYVRYTNLLPGRYTFHARGANPDGVWSETDLVLPIVVRPPWWATWWFRTAAVGALAGATILGIRLRIRHLRSLEQMRLRIASDLHDELGSELSGIALVASMLGDQRHMTPHDRDLLAQVERTSHTTLQALRDIVWYINPEHDNVGSLAARMRTVADGLLGEREHEVVIALAERDAAIPMDRRRHLLLAYKELLHNAVRHAGDCTVRIRFTAAGGAFELEVRDDGRGFDPEQPGSGSGLASLRRRAAHLGATLEVESRPGQGTRVTLRRSADRP